MLLDGLRISVRRGSTSRSASSVSVAALPSSGFAARTYYADGIPHVTGTNLNYPDQTVSLYAAGAIVLSLLRCQEHNCAMHLDTSQRDVAVYILGDELERRSSQPLPSEAE